MNYALEKLIEERRSLYMQQEFLDNHIADCESKLKSFERDKLWNEKIIKQVEEAIRKLE